MWKAICIIILVLAAVTGLSVWSVPLLIAHGSSAAFNMGIGLCILTVAVWIGAYKLVFGK